MNADDYKEIMKSQSIKGLSSLPSLKLYFTPKKSVLYKEPLGKNDMEEDASAVVNWALEEVKRFVLESSGLKYKAPKKESTGSGSAAGKPPVELTEANFRSKVIDVTPDTLWLVEFYAPWCGHCKQLAPTYEKIARTVHSDQETYGDKTFVGAVDATVHNSLGSTYGVQGFPTIKLFIGGKFKEDYSGPRDASSILKFIKENLPPKQVDSSIRQLTDYNSDLQEECMKAPLCVLSFLPSLYDCDAKCRYAYLDILKKEATGTDGSGTGRGWLFLWTEGALNEEAIRLEEDLGVGPGVGYPNLVVINGKKEKYAPFRGSFSKSGIKDFLKGIIYGGAKGATPLYPLPSAESFLKSVKSGKLQSVPKWDGKDAPPLEVEHGEL